MKKTIAKLMAAAMLLSAVPAVSMPSFVSKAAPTAPQVTSTAATSTAESQFKEIGQLGAAPKGEIFSFVLPQGTTKEQFSAASTGGNGLVSPYVNLNIVTDGANNTLMHVVCSVNYSKMTSAQKTDFINSIKNGTNTFRVKLTRKRDIGTGTFNAGGKSYTFNTNPSAPIDLTTLDKDVTSPTPNTLNADDKFNIMFKAEQTFSWTSPKEYRIGGIVEDGKIKSGVMDVDGYLADRNVYLNPNFKVVNDALAEAEILKQDKNEANKIKDNNSLRGQKLILDTIWSGGAEFKVAKLGAQALKEAKMKKIQLKYCNKVGKGALRKCKQLRNVNLKDKNKVRKIHAKAFYDCKNLRSITIDARKLNVVGKDAVGKVHKNCKIKLKASKSKYNDCVKKFKKSGAKNVKYSRLAP